MATKKQRKRAQKDRRHEQAWYDIDEFGNATEISPEEVAAKRASTASDGDGKPQQKRQQQSSRATRTPLPPSWRRSTKRGLILGAAMFGFIALTGRTNGSAKYLSAALLAIASMALFIPYMYGIDRFSYRRWERKAAEQPRKR
jgi:hypothetical protein